MTKQLDQSEGKLSGVLKSNLSAEAFTPSINIEFYDSDDTNSPRIPDPATLKFIIDPENTQGKKSEWIRCLSHATVNGVTTLSSVTRGLQRDATVDLTGSATRAQDWDGSTTSVGVATEPHTINLMRKYFLGTEQIPGNIDIGGTLEVDGIAKFNDQVQLSASDTYLDKVGTDMVFKDPNNPLTTLSQLAAAAGTDTKVRVSANDTTSGFLNGKLIAGEGISFTENNDGANETLTIAAPSNLNYAIDDGYTSAFLTGDTGAQSNFATWAAVTDGSFRISINGVAYNIDAINFTGDLSMDDVAATIQAAIRTATGSLETVVWSTNRFIISSVNLTSSSAITVTSTSLGVVGTDISGAGASDWMDSDVGNGVVTNAVKSDAYFINLIPDLGPLEDGQSVPWEAASSNVGPATLNIDGLGPIPIIKGDYFPLITGDIIEDQKVDGQVCVQAVTFNAGLAGAATSGTLAANWGNKTGVYSVKFSNGDRRDVTLTKGNTTATWSGGLSAVATANAEAQWYQMHTQSSALVGGNNASLQHYHDFIQNASVVKRRQLFGHNLQGTGGGTTTANNGLDLSAITAASNNSLAAWFQNTSAVDNQTNISVHDKNPAFRVYFSFDAATAQEGFIGFVDNAFAGTSLENSIMVLPHFGFVIQDGTAFISVADGATQQKTDISATLTNVTTGFVVSATFDGTTAKFYVNDTQVGSDMATNVPPGNLTRFVMGVIADATAAIKTAYFGTDSQWSYDET